MHQTSFFGPQDRHSGGRTIGDCHPHNKKGTSTSGQTVGIMCPLVEVALGILVLCLYKYQVRACGVLRGDVSFQQVALHESALNHGPLTCMDGSELQRSCKAGGLFSVLQMLLARRPRHHPPGGPGSLDKTRPPGSPWISSRNFYSLAQLDDFQTRLWLALFTAVPNEFGV